MVKGFGNTCMKFLLFIFNFIFVAIGVSLMSLGGYVLFQDKNLNEIIETPDKLAVFVIVIGLITFLVAFFGCCGASSESSCMLSTYAVIVGMVFLIEIALAIVLLLYNKEVPRYLEEGINRSFRQYDAGLKNPDFGAVDFVQSAFQCCGTTGPSFWPSQGKPTPSSCCSTLEQVSNPRVECGNKTWQVGCVSAVNSFIGTYTVVISSVLIFAGAIKIIAACFACSLANAVQF